MASKSKKVLLAISLTAVLLLSGCASLSSVSEGLNAMQTNTTVEEAVTDAAKIEAAIKEAKAMVKSGDVSLYGDSVHTDTVSYGDIVKVNELKSEAKAKRIEGVTYKLYWDINTDYVFWSTDGVDDIRNNENRVQDIKHTSTMELKTKTNISDLK